MTEVQDVLEDYRRQLLLKLSIARERAARDEEELSGLIAELDAILNPGVAARAIGGLPWPRRNDGGAPCAECRLKPGETCDICGAVQPR